MTNRSASSLFQDLREVVNSILCSCVARDAPASGGVYTRYVSMDALRSMLAQGSARDQNQSKAQIEQKQRRALTLRLYDAETMDDPTEGHYLLETSCKTQDSLRGALGKLFQSIPDQPISLWELDPGATFISSFTTEADALTLWRYYGNVCLRFHWPTARSPLYQVRYGDEVNDVLDQLGWVIKPILDLSDEAVNREARSYIRPLRFLFKPEGHRHDGEVRPLAECQEKEWERLDVQCDPDKKDGKTRRLYVEQQEVIFAAEHALNAVIIGPALAASDKGDSGLTYLKEIRYLLDKRDLHDVRVLRSIHRLLPR